MFAFNESDNEPNKKGSNGLEESFNNNKIKPFSKEKSKDKNNNLLNSAEPVSSDSINESFNEKSIVKNNPKSELAQSNQNETLTVFETNSTTNILDDNSNDVEVHTKFHKLVDNDRVLRGLCLAIQKLNLH